MGVDAVIMFRATEPIELERSLPSGYEIAPVPEWLQEDMPEATHAIKTCERYYGIGYERGSWPNICAALMLLHACPNVEKVWYGGDGGFGLPGCTPDDICEISLHFMKHGERPYRG